MRVQVFPVKLRNVVGAAVLLAVSQSSFSEIFKCVDKTTGRTAFTDKACPDDTPGVHQSIGSANIDGGYADPEAKTANKNRPSTEEKAHPEKWQSRAGALDVKKK